jgi:hypothetical protein
MCNLYSTIDVGNILELDLEALTSQCGTPNVQGINPTSNQFREAQERLTQCSTSFMNRIQG